MAGGSIAGGTMSGFHQRAHPGGVSYHVAGGAFDRGVQQFPPPSNMYHAMSGPNMHASYAAVDEGIHGGGGFGSPFLSKLPSSSPTNAGPIDPAAVAMHGATPTYMSSFSRASGFGPLPQQSVPLYLQHLQQPLRSQRHDDYGVDPDTQL